MEKYTRTITACELCGGNCYGCFYAEECNQWCDVAPYNAYEMVTEDHISVALCAARHEIPGAFDGAIFDKIDDPTDVSGLEAIASDMLAGVASLDLYVTGLTVALVAVLNVCHDRGIKVTLWHYDRESGDYYKQEVR